MLERLRMKSNALGTAALSIAMVASVFAMATRNDGYQETRVDLHEAGVWVTKRKTVGRVNTEISEIEARQSAEWADVDLVQSDAHVVAYSDRALRVLDPATMAFSESAPELPEGARVLAGGPTLAVVDEAKGAVWAGSLASAESLSFDRSGALFSTPGTKPVVAVVDLSGGVHVYVVGSSEVHSFEIGPDKTLSPQARVRPLSRPVADPTMTTVGTRVVLLDAKSSTVVPLGGTPVEVAGTSGPLILQQAGPDLVNGSAKVAGPSVLLAGEDELLEVPLEGGSAQVLARGGGGDPVAPARSSGCAYGVWAASARHARVCGKGSLLPSIGSPQAKRLPDPFKPNQSLVFRTNRDRTVLNERNTGYVFTAYAQNPKVVLNWDDADDTDTETEKVDSDKDKVCKPGAELENPVSAGLSVGVRPARPVVLRVFEYEGVKVDKCDAGVVVPGPVSPAAERGQVNLIENGTALQITPLVNTGEFTVPYRIKGTAAESELAIITVRVVPDGENAAPEAKPDSTRVGTGGRVVHNVLSNDRDPDGDVLKLVDVAPAGDQPVEFRADGTVSFSAGPQPGPLEFVYEIEDEYGEADQGTLTIQVDPAGEQPPDPRPDNVFVKVGHRATVNVLANDTDVDTDPAELQLVAVRDESNTLGVPSPPDPDGTVTFAPTVAGTYFAQYRLTDGKSSVLSTIRVQVDKDDGNEAPVAVVDQVHVRASIPAVAPVLANDQDADNDVLAITSVEIPPGSGLAVEVIDLRLLRVIAPQGLDRPQPIRYTVSDGAAGHDRQGVLVVVPYETRVTNQTPEAREDRAIVRAGQWTSVDVLANDVDPEGEQLVVDDDPQALIAPLDEDGKPEGQVFIRGAQIRFRPDANTRGTKRITYGIKDAGGERGSGEIVVRVLSPDDANEPPRAGHVVEARVRAGERTTIPLDLIGLDPDGDVVVVLGVSPSGVPKLGAVKVAAGGITYKPEADSAGPDSFILLVSDMVEPHQPVAVTVRAVVVGDPTTDLPPVAVPDQFTVRVGSGSRSLPILDNDSDPEGGQPKLLVDRPPAPMRAGAGTIALRGGEVIYTPPDHLAPNTTSAEASFTYWITDEIGQPSEGLVRLRLVTERDNEAPVAVDDILAPQIPGRTVIVEVLGNDRDLDDPRRARDVLKVETVDVPADVAVVRRDGSVRVKLGDRSVQFAYRVTDQDGATAMALVVVPVIGSLPPVANPDTAEVVAGREEEITVLGNDENPAGSRSELKAMAVDGSAVWGSVRQVGGKILFKAREQAGQGGFSYVLANDAGQTDVGRVTVTVRPNPDRDREPEKLNRPPQFSPPSAVQINAGDGPLRLDLAGTVSDPDDPVGSLKMTASAAGPLTATLSANRVLSMSAPAGTDAGVWAVRLTVSDGKATVERAVQVTVVPNPADETDDQKPPPQAPRAVDDGPIDTTDTKAVEYPVTDNDLIASGYEAKITLKNHNGAGRATASGTTISYVPNADDAGKVVAITYTLTDSFRPEAGTTAVPRFSTATLRVNVIARPSRPNPPTGTEESKTVNLSWTRPVSNGSIDGYVVEMEGGDRQTTPGTSYPWTGLTNGQSYRFRVAAYNKYYPADQVRDQDFSDYSELFTPDQKPDQPTPPIARFLDTPNNGGAGGTLRVIWVTPNNDGSKITEFIVENDQGSSHNVGGAVTEFDFPDLTNGTAYRFRVTAVNAKGPSEPSGWSTPETPTGKPNAPTVTQIEEVAPPQTASGTDEATVRVHFSAGVNNGGAETFEVLADGVVKVSGAISPAPVVGLEAGRTYTFTVRATNRAGNTTSPGTTGVGYGQAGTPTGLSRTEGDGQISLTWDPASTDGGGTVRYRVYRDGSFVKEVQTTFLDDRGVTNGNSYSYQVSAVGGGDRESPRSSAVTGIPYGEPRFESFIAGAPNGQNIRWSWVVDGYGRDISTLEATLNGTQVKVEHPNSPSSSGGYDGAGLAWNTTHTLCLRVENSGGKVSQECRSSTIGPPPVVFTLPTVVHYTGSGPAGRYQIQWYQAGSWCRIYENDVPIWDFGCGGTAVYPHTYTNFTTPTLTPGTHTWVLEVDNQRSGPIQVVVPS